MSTYPRQDPRGSPHASPIFLILTLLTLLYPLLLFPVLSLLSSLGFMDVGTLSALWFDITAAFVEKLLVRSRTLQNLTEKGSVPVSNRNLSPMNMFQDKG